MIKPSKNLATFSIIFLLLSFTVLSASQKFLPLLLQRTVYYCQNFISSLSVSIPRYLGLIFAILLLMLLLVTIAKFLLVYRETSRARKKFIGKTEFGDKLGPLLRKLKLKGNLILIQDNKPFALCFGIRNPKIYISSGMVELMDTHELEAVLRHEQHHLKNRDGLTMLLAEITGSLFPFFPVLTDIIRNYRIEREVNADREAMKALEDAKPLVSALKKLLGPKSRAIALASAIADQDTLEPRIKALTKKEFTFRKFKARNMLVSLLSVGFLAAIILTPAYAVEIRNSHENAVMMCLADRSCASWCKENNTVIPPQTNT